MYSKKQRPLLPAPTHKPLSVDFDDIASTLRALDERDPPVLIWPDPKSKAGRPGHYPNIQILTLLLSYFTDAPLQEYLVL